MNNGCGNPPVASTNKVAILDAGAQYAKVIDRRLRELNVSTEILPLQTTTPAVLSEGGYGAVIISGGPASVNDEDRPAFHPEIFECGLPILGICYGMQLLNHHYGGQVASLATREDGQDAVQISTQCPLFEGLESEMQEVLLTHGDSVTAIAAGFEVVGRSSSKIVAAIACEGRRQYGVQFHPEVDLTENGGQMLSNFVLRIARIQPDYTMEGRVQGCINHIREVVGSKKVLMLVSGGVDSTVCAALLHKALSKEQVIAVHVNNGFMRYKESEQVEQSLRNAGVDLTVVDASLEFYNASTTVQDTKTSVPRDTPLLCRAVNPEEKRKIIGDTFMHVAEAYIRQLNLKAEDVILGQGTLRPDLIESASGLVSINANTIKTHHNDTGLVRKLRAENRVVEPLKDFHKDEVRKIGLELGLLPDLVNRHPFPGPGLAIRILCAEEKQIQDDQFTATQQILKVMTDFSMHRLKKHAHVTKVLELVPEATLARLSGLFCPVLLPIQSVGVQGDGRSFKYVVALSPRQDSCGDRPSQHWAEAFELARLVPRVCHNVNRVCRLFGPCFTGQITDVTPTHLTPPVIQTLVVADHLVNQAVTLFGCQKKLSQLPVVLIPVDFDTVNDRNSPPCKRSIVIRPFKTSDFMTGKAAVPGKDLPYELLESISSSLIRNDGISRVLYDLTDKPPATTEWE